MSAGTAANEKLIQDYVANYLDIPDHHPRRTHGRYRHGQPVADRHTRAPSLLRPCHRLSATALDTAG